MPLDKDNPDNNFFVQTSKDDSKSQDKTLEDSSLSINYMPLNLASALNELNNERDAMYSVDKSTAAPTIELNQELIQDYIKAHGITSFLGIIKDSIYQAGYIKQEEILLVHKKSGVYIKF